MVHRDCQLNWKGRRGCQWSLLKAHRDYLYRNRYYCYCRYCYYRRRGLVHWFPYPRC
jgi:hypothetical protein